MDSFSFAPTKHSIVLSRSENLLSSPIRVLIESIVGPLDLPTLQLMGIENACWRYNWPSEFVTISACATTGESWTLEVNRAAWGC